MIPITWPFAVWGLDLVGPLKKVHGGFTHLLVTIDKFTKWIEARPISTIKSKQVVLFFLDIIHRFGVPNSIITDNGMQFTGRKFIRFYDEHTFRSIGQPSRTPGQTGKSSTQMACSCRALSPEFSTG